MQRLPGKHSSTVVVKTCAQFGKKKHLKLFVKNGHFCKFCKIEAHAFVKWIFVHPAFKKQEGRSTVLAVL